MRRLIIAWYDLDVASRPARVKRLPCVLLRSVAVVCCLASLSPVAGSTPPGGGLPAPAQPDVLVRRSPSMAPRDLASSQGASAAPGYPAPVRPRRGAPNVLLIMTDDVGFGAASTFGGQVMTPTFDRLAAQGLRYNNFNTAGVCSATRAALLTGRNSHRVGAGTVPEFAYGRPGYNSVLPPEAATVGRILRDGGYSTAWFGKDHNVPGWESGPSGPFARWPNGVGFEYFYGFLAGQTNQWGPELVENQRMVQAPTDDPTYILDRDLADHAIEWLRVHSSTQAGKPFFIYYAPGTAHAPHQAPADWIARYKGRFDGGWDKLREDTFRRQKQMGVIPADAVLTPRPKQIPAWNTLTDQEKKVNARMMEVFAAALSYCDFQIGRVVDELARTGQLKNTLVIYIQGDNGGSAEGGPGGATNGMGTLFGYRESAEFKASQLSLMGGPRTSENYPAGWGWATNTPFQWMKGIASHLGATRNGMVVFWPTGIRGQGELRTQFAHAIDVAPTIIEAAGISLPQKVDGVQQWPLDGASFSATFSNPAAPPARNLQYYEVFGNRALYYNGWLANTSPVRMPWDIAAPAAKPEDANWELYDLDKDFSQSNDLAQNMQAKLAQMKAMFEKVAESNNVLPIETTWSSKVASNVRPSPIAGRESFVYYPSTNRYPKDLFPNLRSSSWRLSAQVKVDSSGGRGVIATQGGWFGGWATLILDGRPTFIYRSSTLPGDTVVLEAEHPIGGGDHVIDVDFNLGDDKHSAFVTLDVDGVAVAHGKTGRIPPAYEEAAVIGFDEGTPVSDMYRLPFAFEGVLKSVAIDLKPSTAR